MSSFGNKIKDNVVAPYNKYSLSQEKLGEVLDTCPDRNTCTISYRDVDGANVIKENVPVKKSSLRGILGGFPKKGDFVELQEVGRIIRVTGVLDKSQLVNKNKENHDNHAGPSNFSGNLGI